jgi:hypothetical protein
MPEPRVVVRKGINCEPLLDTTEANQIEFYDDNGELVALVGHVFSPYMWFYSDKNDSDWGEVLARTGFLATTKG